MPKQDKPSDQELIEALQKGGLEKEKAANYLFQQHIKYASMRMKGVFLKPEERRDAYNWTISKVCLQISTGKFRRQSKLSTYIYESYRNACIDVQRSNTSDKMKSFQSALEMWANKLPSIAQERWKEMDVDTKDLWERTQQAMKRLGDKCRELIWKIDFLGFSLKEVAQELNYASPGSVASSKNRCMKELRTQLGINT